MQDDRSVSKENAGFDSDGRVTGTVTGIYRPPRLAAMPYDEDVSARGRKEKKEARQAAKFANSEMMMELQSEFSSRPQEVFSQPPSKKLPCSQFTFGEVALSM